VPCVSSEKRDLSSWRLATNAYLRRDGSLVLRRVASALAWAGGAPSAQRPRDSLGVRWAPQVAEELTMHPFAKLGVAREGPTQLAQLATAPAPVDTAKIPAELAVLGCMGAKQAGAVETARVLTALLTLECEMAVRAELLALAPVVAAKSPAELSTLDCAAAQQAGLVETARLQTALSTLYCEMEVLAELPAQGPVESAKSPQELSTLDCNPASAAEHCPLQDLDVARGYPQTRVEASEGLPLLQSEERDPFESTH